MNEIIQVEINKIADWRKLSINTEKNKFILFRTKNKKPKYTINILINNNNIKQVKNTTFLGIVIDECLTWCNHLDLITKKNIKCAAIISRIRHFTNLNSLKLIYYEHFDLFIFNLW